MYLSVLLLSTSVVSLTCTAATLFSIMQVSLQYLSVLCFGVFFSAAKSAKKTQRAQRKKSSCNKRMIETVVNQNFRLQASNSKLEISNIEPLYL